MPAPVHSLSLHYGDSDTEIEVDYPSADDWTISKGGKRMYGLERWIMRDRKRRREFDEQIADKLMEVG